MCKIRAIALAVLSMSFTMCASAGERQQQEGAPTSAVIVIGGLHSRQGVCETKAISLVNQQTVAKLGAFFPKYRQRPSSDIAGGWEAGYRVYFNFRDGQALRVTVSENGGGDTWSMGNGDFATHGDFQQFLKDLLAHSDHPVSAESGSEKAPAVSVIKVITGVRPPFARGPGFGRAKPKTFEAAEELAEAVGDKAVEKIGEQVDFQNQFLVFFQWAGSGQDKLSFQIDEERETPKVVFKFRPGRTRDLRPHAYLYAIRKGVTWEIDQRSQLPRLPVRK